MSHDAKVLLGREVTVIADFNPEKKYNIVATSDSSSGKILAHLMNEKGLIRVVELKNLRFKKVWDYETHELVDAKK